MLPCPLYFHIHRHFLSNIIIYNLIDNKGGLLETPISGGLLHWSFVCVLALPVMGFLGQFSDLSSFTSQTDIMFGNELVWENIFFQDTSILIISIIISTKSVKWLMVTYLRSWVLCFWQTRIRLESSPSKKTIWLHCFC